MKDIVAIIQATSNAVFIRPLGLFVRQLLNQLDPYAEDEQLIDTVELVFHEALVNILEHSYQSRESGEVKIEVRVAPQELEFRFEDWGESFDPDKVPEPNLDNPSEGGIGLWFIRQMVDEFHYQSEPDGKNVLRLIKRVPGFLKSQV
jgi:serine/threonine-protein kinase RsbW